ncbi:MAG: DUF2066 domain-containing protein [Pseudomonadota bacterium]
MSRIFLLFLTLFFSFQSISYAAENSPYMVEGVAVSVTGKSPTDARNAAIASGRRDAFLILLTRLEIATNIADTVSNDEISDMVRSEQIDGEKIAGNNYSATMNIMFAKDFVEHILAKKAVKKAEKSSGETYVLLPVKVTKRSMLLWEDDNDWRKAIEKTIAKKDQGKFIVPDADLSNIAVISSTNVALLDYVAIEPLLFKYKSESVYTLFFSYDEIENKVNISVTYLRKLQKKQVKLNFVNVDHLSFDALLEKVANKTIDYLLSSQSTDSKATSTVIKIQIPVSTLGNWMIAKSRIENSNLVTQINIESISRDMAVITVNYPNNGTDIVQEFMRTGINLIKKTDNLYVLTN